MIILSNGVWVYSREESSGAKIMMAEHLGEVNAFTGDSGQNLYLTKTVAGAPSFHTSGFGEGNDIRS